MSDYTGVEKRKILLLSDLLDSSNMLLTELSSKDRANIISGNLGRISSDAVRSKVETLSQQGVRLSIAISELGQRGVDVIFRNEFKKYKFYRKFAPLPEVLFKVGDTNILTDEHAVVVTSLLALTYYIKRKDDDDSSRYIFISDRKLDEAIINIDVAKWISNGKVVLVTNNYHSKASIKSKKTFVSGSRNELDLNNQAIVLDAFYAELFYLCLRGDQIIVGDSEMGIDSRTIEFLRKYRYTNVVVYTVKQKPRVSIMGDWGLVRVAVGDSSSENAQRQQMKKDYDMAECADYGVAVFNPVMVNRYNNIQVSAGTLRNIIHMLNRDKTVPVKLFYWISGQMKHKILRNLDDLWGVLERYKNEIVDDASTESKILHDKVVTAGCITTSEFKYKKIEQKVYSLIREGSAADNQKFNKGPVSTGQLCLVNDL